jgi:acyl carrier protein
MADSNIETEVIRLLAANCGVTPEKVRLSDRLQQDLGMDGDDAVEFFDSLHERFGTDLNHLYEHWSKHFGPEAPSLWIVLAIVAASFGGAMIASSADLSKFSLAMMVIALFVAFFWAIRRWAQQSRKAPVTVDDVVTAVRRGKWFSDDARDAS